MNKKKPILERVDPGFGSSVLVKKHTEFLKTREGLIRDDIKLP